MSLAAYQDLVQSWPWQAFSVAVILTPILTAAAIKTPKKLLLRILTIGAVALLSYTRHLAAPHLCYVIYENGKLGMPAFPSFMHALNLLFFTEVEAKDVNDSWKDGIWLSVNQRGIGTKWQAKNTPSHTSATKRNLIPSRAQFLVRETLIAAWQYLFLDVLYLLSWQQDKFSIIGTAEGPEWLVGWSQTPEQFGYRCLSATFTWFVITPVSIGLDYRAFSIFCVATGLSDPADWPPLFGSIKHAYTLRGLWGNSWHQYLRWDFTEAANFATRQILHLHRDSYLERYTKILIVFAISGYYHQIVDDIYRWPERHSNAVWWFCLFPFGILLEDGVQALWRRISGSEFSDEPPVWRKAVGFTWVVACFYFTLPQYLYSSLRIPQERSGPVPFYLVKGLNPGFAVGFLAMYGAFLIRFYGFSP